MQDRRQHFFHSECVAFESDSARTMFAPQPNDDDQGVQRIQFLVLQSVERFPSSGQILYRQKSRTPCLLGGCTDVSEVIPGEGIELASMEKRSHLKALARLTSVRRIVWSLSQAPAACLCRKRRQQVIPELQPISRGSFSHGVPVSRMNKISRRASLSLHQCLPPLGWGALGEEWV